MTALSYVSAASGNVDAATTTAATAAWSLAAGNHVFVYVRWEANASPAITLTDTAGNTYTALSNNWYNQVGGKWFYCLNAAGNASNVVTATFDTAAQYKNVRAITLAGSVTGVTQTVGTGGGTTITVPGQFTTGAGSMLLVGESCYNNDTSHTFTGLNATWPNVGTTYAYAETAYLARATGDYQVGGPTFTGSLNSASRVIAMLQVEAGGAMPTSPPPATGPVTYVTSAYGWGVGGGPYQTAAFAITTNQHVFVWVSNDRNTSFTATVTDTAGNTYTAAPLRGGTFTDGTKTGRVSGRWYYCLNATGNAANKISVTMSGTSFSYDMGIFALVVSGGITGVTETYSTALAYEGIKHSTTLANGAGSMVMVGEVSSSTGSGTYNLIPEGEPSLPFTFAAGQTAFNNSQSHAMYLARSAGDAQMGRLVYSAPANSVNTNPDNCTRLLSVLQVESGGAVPSLESSVTKLTGYSILGAVPNAASVSKLGSYALLGAKADAANVSKLQAYAVLQVPVKVKSANVAVEVLQASVPSSTKALSAAICAEVLTISPAAQSAAYTTAMCAEVLSVRPVGLVGIINDRDKLLQSTQPRYGAGNSSAILLTASSPTITNGVPASVTFTVTRLNVPGGVAAFTVANGTPFTVSGDTATILASDLTAASETVSVSITDGGATYTAVSAVAKVANGSSGSNGTNGARGAGWWYATGNAWADAVAAAACPGGPVANDMVTIANGTTFALSKRYTGSAWIVPGTLLTGDLFVTGSIGAAAINTNNLTIRDSSGNIILGAGTQLASTYIASISADKIDSGTLNISSSAGGWLLTAGFMGTVVGYRELAGYNIHATALADPGSACITATGYGKEAVHGYNTSGYAGNDALKGQAQTDINGGGVTTSGIVGAQNGYDFYADGAGTNYGPFTGAHDCLLAADEPAEPGDIVIDVECLARNGWSNTLFRVVRSTLPNQAAALGVLATAPRPLSVTTPAVFTEHAVGVSDEGPSQTTQIVTTTDPLYDDLVDAGYLLGGVNALGEGQINVVGEGGDIKAGDLIVTSSVPGKGMRQSDGLVRNITVAKARESATFNAGEVKTIACIYLAG